MFWFLLLAPIILTLVATFSWLELGRIQIRRLWPDVTNRTLDILVFILVAAAVMIPVEGYLSAEYENQRLRESLLKTNQQLEEAKERESLRRWAMVTNKGEEVRDVMGVHSYGSKGPMAERHKKVFIQTGPGETTYAGPFCNDPSYVAEAKALVRDYPKLPYAYVILTWCLKNLGDPSWREQGERARKVAEKLMSIEPHVLDIDGSYAILIREVFGEKLEDTGYFRPGEQGSYVPRGWPN